MITKIKHFFIGGMVSGGLLAIKNVYLQFIGCILLGYLAICGMERLITNLKAYLEEKDNE